VSIGPPFGLVYATQPRTELDVAKHGQPRVEVGLLEHHAPLAARRGDLRPVDGDRALGRLDEPGQQLQQGRLTAARRPCDTDEFARLDNQVDIVERVELGTLAEVPLGDVVDHQPLCRRVGDGCRRFGHWVAASAGLASTPAT
jgi:hypothetical protein